ncbi:hypothetical protein C0075_27265, partial [Rhizobium sp. KAs_5_22]
TVHYCFNSDLFTLEGSLAVHIHLVVFGIIIKMSSHSSITAAVHITVFNNIIRFKIIIIVQSDTKLFRKL